MYLIDSGRMKKLETSNERHLWVHLKKKSFKNCCTNSWWNSGKYWLLDFGFNFPKTGNLVKLTQKSTDYLIQPNYYGTVVSLLYRPDWSAHRHSDSRQKWVNNGHSNFRSNSKFGQTSVTSRASLCLTHWHSSCQNSQLSALLNWKRTRLF